VNHAYNVSGVGGLSTYSAPGTTTKADYVKVFQVNVPAGSTIVYTVGSEVTSAGGAATTFVCTDNFMRLTPIKK
jgi:hypothetical protein